eukprot:1039616-Rhodomonas_salina.7
MMRFKLSTPQSDRRVMAFQRQRRCGPFSVRAIQVPVAEAAANRTFDGSEYSLALGANGFGG